MRTRAIGSRATRRRRHVISSFESLGRVGVAMANNPSRVQVSILPLIRLSDFGRREFQIQRGRRGLSRRVSQLAVLSSSYKAFRAIDESALSTKIPPRGAQKGHN
jgi:hypothetical protein